MSAAQVSIPRKFQPLLKAAVDAPRLKDGSYRWLTFNQAGFPIDEAGEVIKPEDEKFYGHKRWKFYIYYGGRGGGKSEQMVLISIILKAIKENFVILCCRETQTSLKDSLYETIKVWITTLGYESIFELVESEIRCKSTGSKFLFRGLRTNAQEIKSMKGIGLVIVDEAVNVSDDSWEWLIPTPRLEGAEFWIAFNTGTTEDATYRRFVTNADERCYVSLVNIDDNPLAPKILLEERDAAKKLAEKLQSWDRYENTWLGKVLAAKSGEVFFPSQIRIVTALPVCIRWTRGHDLASSAVSEKNPTPDFTASFKMGVTSEGIYCIADVTRMRATADQVEAALLNIATLDGLEVTQSIPQDPGQAGKFQVGYLARKLSGFRVHTSVESGDKVTRAMPFASQVNAGNVIMIAASWNRDLINEMTAFGSEVGFDDQIDAGSRAFQHLQTNNVLQQIKVVGL